jgi:serine/threonine-protein kinase
MSAFTPGLRIHERFTLVERIGVGGMSEVWRAVDAVLGRPVAVKVLSAAMANDPNLWQATLREARAVAQIAHPNVAQVHDYGEVSVAGGAHVPYLVMELIQGRDLAERLRSGPLPWPQAAPIAAQAAAGLAAAHRLGVVHRDVKPANIMLTPTGVKVLDFGIAALAFGPDSDRGRLIGTPAYAAPERLQPGAPTPAGDVYALGVVLYEMLTGRPPRSMRDWPEAAAAHREGFAVPPIQVPGLPRRLAELVARCLSVDPARRPTATEVADVASALREDTTAVLPAAAAPRPTLVASPAAFGSPAAPAGEYAVGSARLPQRPAQDRTPHPTRAGKAGGPPKSSRLLPVILVAGVGVLVAILAIALSGGPSTRDTGSTQPGTSSSAQDVPAAAEPSAMEPSTAETSTVDNTDPRAEAAAAFDRTLTEAVAAGTMDADIAKELRSKLDDIRNQLNENGRARKRINDLTEKIKNLADDDRIDGQTAKQLIGLLQTLAG